MRIVDVNEFYSPTGGGVRTYIDRKMQILADRGHELIVIAPGREDRTEERPGGGRIVHLRSPGMPFDRNYGLFWDQAPIHALLDRFDPDVVETCSPWRPAWIVARWRGGAGGCARRCWRNAACRRARICCSASGITIPKSARRHVGLVLLGQGMAMRALKRRIGESPHFRLFKPLRRRRIGSRRDRPGVAARARRTGSTRPRNPP